MAWSDTIDAGDDLIDAIRTVCTGANERARVMAQTLASTVPAGTNIQAIWANINTICRVTIIHGDESAAMYAALTNRWLDPDDPWYLESYTPGTYVSSPHYRFYYATVAGTRDANGLPDTYPDGATGTIGTNQLLRRRRFRRLTVSSASAATATADDQGNAATAGQYAYDTGGNTWRCVASGNWVRDESQQPDVLDNANLLPNAVNEANSYPADYSAGSTLYSTNSGGAITSGDFIDATMLEERRLHLDRLKYTGTLPSTNPANNNEWQTGSETSYATAVSVYNADTPLSSSFSSHPYAYNRLTISYYQPLTDPTWRFIAERTVTTYSFSKRSTPTNTYARKLTSKVFTDTAQIETTDPTVKTYELHGAEAWSDNEFVDWESTAATSANTYTAPAIGGTLATRPDPYPDFSGSLTAVPPTINRINEIRVWGYRVRAVVALEKWNVSGGMPSVTVVE